MQVGNEREREKSVCCLSLTEELLYSSTLSSGRQWILQEATYYNIRSTIYIICSVVSDQKNIYIFFIFSSNDAPENLSTQRSRRCLPKVDPTQPLLLTTNIIKILLYITMVNVYVQSTTSMKYNVFLGTVLKSFI